MSTDLSLNGEQSKKSKAIYLDHFNKLYALHEKEKKHMVAFKAVHANLKKKFKTKIKRELKEEQVRTYVQFFTKTKKVKVSASNV